MRHLLEYTPGEIAEALVSRAAPSTRGCGADWTSSPAGSRRMSMRRWDDPAPGEREAADRSWDVVRDAYEERIQRATETRLASDRDCRRRRCRLAGAVTPAGHAVFGSLRDAVRGERNAAPALFSLPTPHSRLLVNSADGHGSCRGRIETAPRRLSRRVVVAARSVPRRDPRGRAARARAERKGALVDRPRGQISRPALVVDDGFRDRVLRGGRASDRQRRRDRRPLAHA